MEQVGSVIVIGAGLAGARTVEELRRQGYEGDITLVGAERHLPYIRPPLSKGYLQGREGLDAVVVHPRQWYEEHGIALRLDSPVTRLDVSQRTVLVRDGSVLRYDAAVIATGSRPRALDVPGADLAGVVRLRTLDDSDQLRTVLEAASRIAIVGGGWIGLEVAAAARYAGVDVVLLEAAPLPLGRVLGPEMAAVFAELHRAHGVDLRTETSVASLTGDDGRVVAVQLTDGTAVAAEAVLVGVGITPAVELAQDAGLTVDNGIVVDAGMRTSDPQVLAVGDVANAWHPVLERRLRVEHWANAMHQPAVAASTILGGDAGYDRLPYFYTDQYDLGMEYVGYVEPGGYDEVVVRGDLAAREFLAFWISGGCVLAGMNVNVWDVVEDVRALVLAGRPVDRHRLADPAVPLASLL
jgi:3-phenylpropionate/trans-cinnamate dioxygenase ferredoxin reductase component